MSQTTYAKGTEISVDQTQTEIRKLLQRYGATGFIMGETAEKAQIGFEMGDRRVIFRLPLPAMSEFRKDGRGRLRTDLQRQEAWKQACKSKWRALVLCIKAKLETVASGIETFDEAFMAHLALPSGETMGEWAAREENQRALFASTHVPLLPGPSS